VQAIRSGNVEQIRQAQLRIAQRRTGATPFAHVPWTAGVGRTPGLTPRPEGCNPPKNDEARVEQAEIPTVSLDTFLSNHTSEDNASFQSILEHTNKRRQERAAVLLAPRNSSQLLTDGRERTDGFGTTGQQPDTQAGWRYQPINLLMYSGGNKASLPLSKRELQAMPQGDPKSINHHATRLRSVNPAASGHAMVSPSSSIDTDNIEGSGGSGDLHRSRDTSRPCTRGGYDILATPSFEPGVDASPFVTWGEIEGTPMRIEEEDLPGGLAAAAMGKPSSFRLKETPRREAKAHELAAKVSSKRRSTPSRTSLAGRAALVALGRAERTPGGGNTPLSAAAQRLAGDLHRRRKGGGISDADEALRASYRGTPLRHGGGGWEAGDAKTPCRSSSGWTPVATPRARQ